MKRRSLAPSIFVAAVLAGAIPVLGTPGQGAPAALDEISYVMPSGWVAEALRGIETPRIILGMHIPGVPGMRVLLFSAVLLLLILFYRRGLMGDSEFSWEGLLGGIKSRLGKGREGARS